MRLLVCGLSITSSWGNGHATVYRGLLKALHRQGAEVTFIEKDVPWYAENRDLPCPTFTSVELYRDQAQLLDLLESELSTADVVFMGSYFPDGNLLVDRLGALKGTVRLYYDIDTPVTLAAFRSAGAAEYLRADQLPLFDSVLSFTGGRALIEMQRQWGARRVHPFYCALDPETHTRQPAEERYCCRLSYMGTYSADRHAAWERLFLHPALSLPDERFVLAGPQYPDVTLPPNVRHFQHIPPSGHPSFYSSSDLTLNLTRGPMVEYGYSPSVRLFEAAGCASCIVSDEWEGLDEVFTVGEEILLARDGEDVVRLLTSLSAGEARSIGEKALARALRDHTYDVRASQFMELVSEL